MTDKQIIDLTEIDKKYKDKCSLIKAGKCKNVNIFIEQSRKLKAKEQECERLKKEVSLLKEINSKLQQIEDVNSLEKCYLQQLDKLKKENEKMSKGYAELTEIVSSYIDDFTGYNEKLGGFDIVLCIKELSHQLDQLKVEIEQEKALKETYLTCYKAKHEDIEGVLFKLKQTLTEIKAICNNNDELQGDFNVVDCDKYKLGKHNLANKILQKIKEYKVEE